jgi:hypothetical protein
MLADPTAASPLAQASHVIGRAIVPIANGLKKESISRRRSQQAKAVDSSRTASFALTWINNRRATRIIVPTRRPL